MANTGRSSGHAGRSQHQRPVMRTTEIKDDSFGDAVRGVVLLDRVEQLVPA
jgi:hypothetical protein